VKQDRGFHRLLRALSYATASSIPTVKIATGAFRPGRGHLAERVRPASASAKVVGTGSDLSLDLGAAYTTKTDNAYPIVLVTYEIALRQGQQGRHPAADQVLPDLHRQ